MTKRVYEAPVLIRSGAFSKVTGLLQRNGRDRLIFSKN
ncbi:keywimysin-related RiPP [Actinosynnema sp. NPDC002837]